MRHKRRPDVWHEALRGIRKTDRYKMSVREMIQIKHCLRGYALGDGISLIE